ncbi:MAG: tyrosine-type recombinase/integrase [Gemmataceae bacterium]
MPRRKSVPTYRLHSQSGQAIVTLRDPFGNRRDVLLGEYNSPESRAEYLRVVGQWETNGRRWSPKADCPPGDLTVNEFLVHYAAFAVGHYRRLDGSPTGQLDNIRYALRPLKELYGHTPAGEFGPLALRTVRERMIASGLARTVVNARVGMIRRAFKWAVSMELVPAVTYQALSTVQGLQRGRCQAREPAPVEPVPDQHVEAALPFMRPPVAAMVVLQRAAGLRSGEVMVLRRPDIDRRGPTWVYAPANHKTAYLGRPRVVYLGPRAQAALQPFLDAAPDDDAFLFSPARDREERLARRRKERQTPLYPSHARRLAGKRRITPGRVPRQRYDHRSYRWAIHRACKKAGVPVWHPHQLRHSHATAVRKQFGLEAAQAALGHAKMNVTELYAQKDQTLAERVAREVG